MSYKKHFLSIALSAALVTSCFTTAFAAESTFTDVDPQNSEAIVYMTENKFISGIDETKFGSKCTRKICQKLPPIHFAAIRYSLSRSCRTSVRTIFAIFIQLVSPITMVIATTEFFPASAWRKIINRIEGILNKISVKRIINSSIHSGAIPLKDP